MVEVLDYSLGIVRKTYKNCIHSIGLSGTQSLSLAPWITSHRVRIEFPISGHKMLAENIKEKEEEEGKNESSFNYRRRSKALVAHRNSLIIDLRIPTSSLSWPAGQTKQFIAFSTAFRIIDADTFRWIRCFNWLQGREWFDAIDKTKKMSFGK